ncbi:MAG: hypothetical protein ABEJ75_00720, partial [Candidatus Nanohaloarchaea archaeon]
MKRRDYILASGAIMAGLAGCNTTQKDKETPTSTETTTTVEKNQPGNIQLNVKNGKIKLPPIWGQHSIENLSPQVNAKVSDPDGLKQVAVKTGDKTVR